MSVNRPNITRSLRGGNIRSEKVTYCHQHNIVEKDLTGTERNFGIRVTLPSSDTFSRVLGNDWENIHWYRSELERDRAFDEMAKRHGYYRKTDTPTQILEKIFR